jgi:hypothetical protein
MVVSGKVRCWHSHDPALGIMGVVVKKQEIIKAWLKCQALYYFQKN